MDAGSPAVRSWLKMTDWMPLAIVSAPPTIMATGAAVLGLINRYKLDTVGKNVDGNLKAVNAELAETKEALLTLTRKSSHAEGVKDEKKAGRKPK